MYQKNEWQVIAAVYKNAVRHLVFIRYTFIFSFKKNCFLLRFLTAQVCIENKRFYGKYFEAISLYSQCSGSFVFQFVRATLNSFCLSSGCINKIPVF
jgi:hypothetical protein